MQYTKGVGRNAMACKYTKGVGRNAMACKYTKGVGSNAMACKYTKGVGSNAIRGVGEAMTLQFCTGIIIGVIQSSD